jgi:hypothetical protein
MGAGIGPLDEMIAVAQDIRDIRLIRRVLQRR